MLTTIPTSTFTTEATVYKPPATRRVAAVFCNVFGTLILVAVIVLLAPLALPAIAGIEVLNIETGSMEPAIPVGSAVFVHNVDPTNVVAQDVIAFSREDETVVHRVMSNMVVEGQLVTKGDANSEVDLDPVPYSNYIGKVVFNVPALGDFLTAITTTVGKVYLFLFAVCGVLFNVLAGRLRKYVPVD